MNSFQKMSEIKNPFFIYYYENDKPKLLKKANESQMQKSIEKLQDKGLAYFAIELTTMEIITSGYTEKEYVNENYALIVKSKDELFFYTVGPRPFYDEAVYLSAGDFVMINRKEKEFVKHIC